MWRVVLKYTMAFIAIVLACIFTASNFDNMEQAWNVVFGIFIATICFLSAAASSAWFENAVFKYGLVADLCAALFLSGMFTIYGKFEALILGSTLEIDHVDLNYVLGCILSLLLVGIVWNMHPEKDKTRPSHKMNKYAKFGISLSVLSIVGGIVHRFAAFGTSGTLNILMPVFWFLALGSMLVSSYKSGSPAPWATALFPVLFGASADPSDIHKCLGAVILGSLYAIAATMAHFKDESKEEQLSKTPENFSLLKIQKIRL